MASDAAVRTLSLTQLNVLSNPSEHRSSAQLNAKRSVALFARLSPTPFKPLNTRPRPSAVERYGGESREIEEVARREKRSF